MDAEAGEILQESIQINFQNPDAEDLVDKLMEALEKNNTPTWEWTNFCLNESTQLNVVAFSSSWGDGCYASYWDTV